MAKHHVTIKGVKDGLIFLLNDACEFSDLLTELKHKLENTHQQILTGPTIPVHVKLGNRSVSEADKDCIRGIIARRGNLDIQSIESSYKPENSERPRYRIEQGIIRSGQTLHADGNILYLGDVNPGGTITSTGDIYVMGSLRGMAHAGIDGNEDAVIAASHLRPIQLRIAHVISRPPDEWGIGESFMEFAYLREHKMEIDKIIHLHRLRPAAWMEKGE